MKLSNKAYDTMKWVAQYLLPATATLYFAISGIWGLPYGEQVVGTITAIDTFLGVLLGLSTLEYRKGNLADGVLQVNSEDPEKDVYQFVLNVPFEELYKKDSITFTVDHSNVNSQ